MELKRMWKLTDVKVLPLVISVEGAVSKSFKEFLKMFKGLYVPMQKHAFVHIFTRVRKLLAIG